MGSLGVLAFKNEKEKCVSKITIKDRIQFSAALTLLFSISLSLNGCSSSPLSGGGDEKIRKVVGLFEALESFVTQKNPEKAKAALDEIISSHGDQQIEGISSPFSYGDLAQMERARLDCNSRRSSQAHELSSSRSTLKEALRSALQSGNASQLEMALGCVVGRAQADGTHQIVNNAAQLAQEIVGFRKDSSSHLISFTTSDPASNLLLTSGYSDGKSRRFSVAFDSEANEWFVLELLEGSLPALVSAEDPAAEEPQVQSLTPAQEQQMRADFAQYTDPDGLVSQDINPGINTSGNGLLYTSYYYTYLDMYGVLTDADRQRWTQIVQACRKDGINGLYNRTPTKTDQEGPDDYYGITMSASPRVTETQMASDVFQYGQNNYVLAVVNWVFNNQNPGQFSFSAWMGRQPQFVAHVEMAVDRLPEMWRRPVWMLTLLLSKTGNPDGNQEIVLNWPLAANVNPKLFGMRMVAKDWKRRVQRNYANGMKQVFSTYFNNPSHPLAVWAVTDFPW